MTVGNLLEGSQDWGGLSRNVLKWELNAFCKQAGGNVGSEGLTVLSDLFFLLELNFSFDDTVVAVLNDKGVVIMPTKVGLST